MSAEYLTKQEIVLVQWEESSSGPMHYMYSLDEMAYQMAVVNPNDEISIAHLTKETYLVLENVPAGTHSICIIAVCVEMGEEYYTTEASAEICIDFVSRKISEEMFVEQNKY